MHLSEVEGRLCVVVEYGRDGYTMTEDEPASWPEEVRHLLAEYRVDGVEVRAIKSFGTWRRAAHVRTEDGGEVVFFVV